MKKWRTEERTQVMLLRFGSSDLQCSVRAGQTLVEIIAAIGVVVILVTGLIVGATGSLKASQYGRAKSLSVRYAEEAAEIVRSLRDASWETFTTYGGTTPKAWCLDKGGTWSDGASGCPVNIDDIYTRTVTFTWLDPRMKVEILVTWTDGARAYQSDVTTYFTQWR